MRRWSLMIAITVLLGMSMAGRMPTLAAPPCQAGITAPTGIPISTSTPVLTPTATASPTPTSTYTPTPTPLPDLVVVSITTYPSPLVKDQPGTVRVEVKNKGSAATTTNCWVGLYIDRAPLGEPDQQRFSPALNVDQPAIVSFTVTLADVGYHPLTAWVDFLGAISEGNEDNNQYSDYIIVAEPTPTPTPTSTPLPTPTPTYTPLPSSTPTPTPIPSPTPTSTSTPTPSPTPTPRPGEPVNLVYNGGFEGAFVHYEGLGEVADGWTPFVETQGAPQFLRGKKRSEGQSSQRIWSDYVPFRAGIYQRITGVIPGQTYIARAAVLSIFGEGDKPIRGMNIGKQIGLDPKGGENPSSPSVVWSDVNWEDRAWQKGEKALWVSATAEASIITIFIRVNNVYGGHNDLFYVDEVTLYPFQPTPTPTRPSTPTATPTSTPFPSPTMPLPSLQTSTPSATPLSLATAISTSVPTSEGEGQPPLTPTPTPSAPSTHSSIGRFILLFFALALGIIIMLTLAILWLQRTAQ